LVDELGDGVPALQWAEFLDEPGVERSDEAVFAQDHVAGMFDLVDEGVFLRVAASVVGDAVCVQTLHPALADSAEDRALEHVRVPGAIRPAALLRSPVGGSRQA
jgi:hypothetical protein